MQKLTLTCIYGKDDTRKLKYRVTDDMPVGVMLEKLISFQFVIDCADPKTFNVVHNGEEISDLTSTFGQLSIADGDELYIIPTVYDPIPPLPEVDVQPRKSHQKNGEGHSNPRRRQQQSQNRQHGRGHSEHSRNDNHQRPSHSGSNNHRKPSKPAENAAPKQASQPSKAEEQNGSVPFKRRSRNFKRTHNRSSSKNNN